jgi:hypothetical protein
MVSACSVSTMKHFGIENMNLDNVNRIEVIDNNGRAYVKYDVDSVVMQLQDDGKTLKLFVKYIEEEEISDD